MNLSVKRIIKQLKTKETRDYVRSTHFWGPLFNWGIPLAAIADTRKDPKFISGNMTLALCLYSGIFMRFAVKVVPRNNLLFGCHIANFSAQLVQLGRYVNYRYNQKKNAEKIS